MAAGAVPVTNRSGFGRPFLFRTYYAANSIFSISVGLPAQLDAVWRVSCFRLHAFFSFRLRTFSQRRETVPPLEGF